MTVSGDPRDLNPLTLNQLLLLRHGTSLAQGLFVKSDMYSKRGWRQVQYLADIFGGTCILYIYSLILLFAQCDKLFSSKI